MIRILTQAEMARGWIFTETSEAPREAAPEAGPEAPREAARHPWPAKVLIACLLIATTVSAGLIWRDLSDREAITIQTPVGAYHRAALSDGSVVESNTDTTLKVLFAKNVRRILLTDGEAYFRVAHDPDRPFIVQVGQTLIRATGTEFMVRVLGSGQTSVVVTQGQVVVSHLPTSSDESPEQGSGAAQPTYSQALSAGHAAVDNGVQVTVQDLKPEELAARQSWRTGVLMFTGQSVDEVVRELNRYSPCKLVAPKGAGASKPLGGRFEPANREEFRQSLKELGIRSAPCDAQGER